ncbi:MAG: membrane protein insertase YidC [Candidatus Thiodiazotropha lotti]|uniref:Membrane protein insertase YidC n=1 Tax=Candidatus Thiodiazotropha lotti TaxID=2792787 RepID=A0A9E4K7S1_9GAMM|nr:membrane protein insertase YidC [Candidatus Thiodiazotropha lotti]MCG7921734.1 membrane protein insertase YidC [Candidatus Thiodiazotropha lotti]MCG7940320.1 membrane protein insertase YidC [Candidatus Thiodiazotropha lotti]MCG7986878.1 membrane protein insertase YidC [Candidatus Thiodiazotropha lotti]MCG8002098.1 membrane protein insertase YidC [Candidatus Thiodiazotropha lotti]
MDNLRLILFFTLAFLGLLIYQAWQQDYGVPAQREAEQAARQSSTPAAPQGGEDSGVPTAAVKADLPQAAGSAVPGELQSGLNGQVIHVVTDLLKLEISTQGGTVQLADLLEYFEALDTPDLKVELLSPSGSDLYIAQSGLIGSEKGKAPNHEAIYQSEQTNYEMGENQDQLIIPMVWKSDNGVTVTKQFTLNRGSYLIDVDYLIENQSGESWAARDYGQLQRVEPDGDGSGFTTYTYTGGVYYNPKDKYEKVDFDDMASKKLDIDTDRGWLAMIQHYFLSAWIPPKDQVEHYYTNALTGGKYLLGSYSPSITVENGETQKISRQLYIGPKLQDQLEQIAEGLELTVDYGWLTVIAKPIFWLLKSIHNMVGNWGWAIILLTLLIKAVFYKLSETSYKSMANMRKFTPRVQALKDRYGDDKQRFQQAMMELYKTEKINPLGGCLPILVQIPVFIALYWVLLESVELRHAPWILWIESLSEKDPYFILPLIMGVSMFVQQKLNPAPPDPMQAKIMMSLPFVFTIFFAFFPAGLVLYWVVNNLISIAQQWYITRKIENAAT